MRCLLVLIPILLLACQKESQVQLEADSSTLKPNMSQREVLDFLVQHESESFTPELRADIEEMLKEPEVPDFSRANDIIEVPAGSVDALQSAVDEAGPGGTVKLLAGDHIENQMVRIDHPLKLVGENGANLIVDNPIPGPPPSQVIPGVYVKNADRTVIRNISFSTLNEVAGAALFVESSKRVVVTGNNFKDFMFSIIMDKTDHAKIMHNDIVGTPLWLDGTIPSALGITLVNGRQVSVVHNTVSQNLFGIWPCDKGGVSWGNETSGNFIGQILCRVPPTDFITPDGDVTGAQLPATQWLCALNKSNDNFFAGYIVIDGAQKNILLGNQASGNANYDIELVGDSERFGFFTPTSQKNTVYSFPDLTIKDCGEMNRVFGGIAVDISEDPCF